MDRSIRIVPLTITLLRVAVILFALGSLVSCGFGAENTAPDSGGTWNESAWNEANWR